MDLRSRSLEVLLAEQRETLSALEALIRAVALAPSSLERRDGGPALYSGDGRWRERFAAMLAACRARFAEEEASLAALGNASPDPEAVAAHRYDHAVIAHWLAVVERELAEGGAGADPWPALVVAHSWLKDHVRRYDAAVASRRHPTRIGA